MAAVRAGRPARVPDGRQGSNGSTLEKAGRVMKRRRV